MGGESKKEAQGGAGGIYGAGKGTEEESTCFVVAVQVADERVHVTVPTSLTPACWLIDRLQSRCRGMQVHGLLAADGVPVDPTEPLSRFGASLPAPTPAPTLIASCGATDPARRATASLCASGVLGCLPRPTFVPFPAAVPSRRSGGSRAPLGTVGTTTTLNATLLPCPAPPDTFTVLYLAVNGDLSDAGAVPAQAFPDGGPSGPGGMLLARGGPVTRVVQALPVNVTDKSPLTTVKSLCDWVRVRVGSLPDWCVLSACLVDSPDTPFEKSSCGGGWETLGPPLDPGGALPKLGVGQALLVSTPGIRVEVTSATFASWRLTASAAGGRGRSVVADPGQVVLASDPIRKSEWARAIATATKKHPFLARVRRCAVAMPGTPLTLALGDEVSFADERPGATSASQRGPVPSCARVSLRIVPTNAGLPPATASPFPDAAVWAEVPPHLNVLPLLFTAGPQLLFSPFVNAVPVVAWLQSWRVQDQSRRHLSLTLRTVMLHLASALEHIHAHGVAHLAVHPSNVEVRVHDDAIATPLYQRCRVLLTDHSLSATRLLPAPGETIPKGGIPGFWAPEQVPEGILETADSFPEPGPGRLLGRWFGDSDPALKWGLAHFVEASRTLAAQPPWNALSAFLACPAGLEAMRCEEEAIWSGTNNGSNGSENGSNSSGNGSNGNGSSSSGNETAGWGPAWQTLVEANRETEVGEGADAWGWAMTGIYLTAISLHSRLPPEKLRPPHEDPPTTLMLFAEWTEVAEDGLGRALAAALAPSPGKRPLLAHAAHALRVGDGLQEGDARECLDQEDEAGCLIPLLNAAQERVLMCEALFGRGDPQTMRAAHVLRRAQLSHAAGLRSWESEIDVRRGAGSKVGRSGSEEQEADSVDDSNGHEPALLEGAVAFLEWFNTQGPPEVVAWHTAFSQPAGRGGAKPARSDGPTLDPCSLGGPWRGMYLSALCTCAMAHDLCGNRSKAGLLFSRAAYCAAGALGASHRTAAAPALLALRLRSLEIEAEIEAGDGGAEKAGLHHAALEKIEMLQAWVCAKALFPPEHSRGAASDAFWPHRLTLPAAGDTDEPGPPPWKALTSSEKPPADTEAARTVCSLLLLPGGSGGGLWGGSQPPPAGTTGEPPGGPGGPGGGSAVGLSAQLLLGMADGMGETARLALQEGRLALPEDRVKARERHRRARVLAQAAVVAVQESYGALHPRVATTAVVAASMFMRNPAATEPEPPLVRHALALARLSVQAFLNNCPSLDPAPPHAPVGPSVAAASGRVHASLSLADLAAAYTTMAEAEDALGLKAESADHSLLAMRILLRHEEAAEQQEQQQVLGAGLDSAGGGAGAKNAPATKAAAPSYTCAAAGCVKVGLFQCGSCKKVRYCSVNCQREDWPIHKVACKGK